MSIADLKTKALTLARVAWNRSDLDWPAIQRWLQHFLGERHSREIEQEHALYLLTQFTYFGNEEIRELLKSVFRDLVIYPILEDLRVSMSDCRDEALLKERLRQRLSETRFVGLGGPASSGTHLLYLFRQEAKLPAELFLSVNDLPLGPATSGNAAGLEGVQHLIFLDDICGTGHTVEDLWIEKLRDSQLARSGIRMTYLAIIGLASGFKHVRDATGFSDTSTALFELDESYKAHTDLSRYIDKLPTGLSKSVLGDVLEHYGRKISTEPFGYEECGLLVGFHHNTPDNTLPIFWESGSIATPWCPPFKRYKKEPDLP